MDRKIIQFLLLVLLLLPINAYATEQWLVGRPLSADAPANFPADQLANNDSTDRLLANFRQGMSIAYTSSSSLTVAAGSVVCVDSAVRHWFRNNPSGTVITAANLDAGVSFANSTTYTVYANCSADATTATFTISTNATTPTGPTAFRAIGTFTTDASANVLPERVTQEASGYVMADSSGNKSVQGIFDYGTSASAFTFRTGNLKVAYGSLTIGGSSSSSISNLPFTSSSSYRIYASATDGPFNEGPSAINSSGSAASVTNNHNDSRVYYWFAIGT